MQFKSCHWLSNHGILNNSLHLVQKHARISPWTSSVPRSKQFSESLQCSLRKTVSFEKQITSKDKYPSIFSNQMEAIVRIFLHMFHKMCCFENWGISFVSFGWEIFSRAQVKIWWIIRTIIPCSTNTVKIHTISCLLFVLFFFISGAIIYSNNNNFSTCTCWHKIILADLALGALLAIYHFISNTCSRNNKNDYF